MIRVPIANTVQLQRIALRQSYLFALLLLIIAVAVNAALQPDFFRPGVLSDNLQSFLPLMLLAAGQTIVIIGGGVDLSVGAIVSLVDVEVVGAMWNSPVASHALLPRAQSLARGEQA